MARSKPRRPQRRTLRVVSSSAAATGLVAVPAAGGPSAVNDGGTTVAVGTEGLKRTQPPPTRLRKTQKPAGVLQRGFLWGVRMGIVGLGLGAIAGTTLTVLSPTKFITADKAGTNGQKSLDKQAPAPTRVYPQQLMAAASGWVASGTNKVLSSSATAASQITGGTGVQKPTIVTPTQENTDLKGKLSKLASTAVPQKIVPYAYFIDTDNGQFVNLNGDKPLPAASTIKVPVAIAFFEAVDQGKIKLHEQIPLTKDVVGSGSGDLQYQVGKQSSYSALDVVTKMIVISDNTATNMLIKRLGGMAALNQRFQAWQLSQTKLNNPLPDLEGTNTTSPKDLALLLARLQAGELLSLKSRDRLMNIMQETKTRTLLPQGLEPGALISHKTGDIGKVLGDAGIIDMPNGQRYVGAVLATRPYNDPKARTLIQDISRTVYQHYKAINPPPKPAAVASQPKPDPAKAAPNVAPQPAPKATVKPSPKPAE